MFLYQFFYSCPSPSTVAMRRPFIIDSVDQWLLDIQGAVEMECMSVLQGKSILKHMDKYAINSAAIRSMYLNIARRIQLSLYNCY